VRAIFWSHSFKPLLQTRPQRRMARALSGKQESLGAEMAWACGAPVGLLAP